MHTNLGAVVHRKLCMSNTVHSQIVKKQGGSYKAAKKVVTGLTTTLEIILCLQAVLADC